jgi:predicted CxxxxCH...CXXCH cytochrome family protein
MRERLSDARARARAFVFVTRYRLGLSPDDASGSDRDPWVWVWSGALIAMMGLVMVVGCAGDEGGAGAGDVPVEATSDAQVADSLVDDAGVEVEPATPDVDEPEVTPACGSCHGTLDDPTPPPDLSGAVDPAASGVGAHAAHVAAASTHAPVRCKHCHVVPEDIDALGHRDDARPADVTHAGLAVAAGASGEYIDGHCAVYCHGSALRIDPVDSPAWTSTEVLGCEGCHGQPPAAPHPQASDCQACHLEVIDEGGAIIRPAFHGDSILQAPHGAHTAHLGWSEGPRLACESCHPVVEGVVHVHGPLKDDQDLAHTTICLDCHAEGEVSPEEWHAYSSF